MLVYSGKDRDLNMKRILAMLLTVCMVVWMIPATAFADDEDKMDLSAAKITLADNTDYYKSEKVNETNFVNSFDDIKVNGEAVDQTVYKIVKIIANDKVTVRLTAIEGKSTGAKIEEFDIVSTIFNNNDYFISSDSNMNTAKDLIAEQEFTGAEVKPYLYVYKKDSSGKAIEKVDSSLYDVSYGTDNTNVGTVAVTITGKGKARGSVASAFEINPADASKVTVNTVNTKIKDPTKYDGLTVKLGNVTLKKTADYNVRFTDNEGKEVNSFNAGNRYCAVVKLNDAKFRGNREIKSWFDVEEKLSGEIVLSSYSFKYTGYSQMPTITVKKNSTEYSTGFAYTCYNADGKEVTYPTDAGTYKVVVKGDGKTFIGTDEKTFVISHLQLGNQTTAYADYAYISGLDPYYAYVNRAVEPEFNVIWNGRTLKKNVDYTVYYTNNNGVGTGKINVSFKGNFYGSIDGTFTIIKGKEISNATVYISPIADQAYTGYDIKPSVYVYYGGRTAATAKTLLSSYYDYDVTYTANKNAGTATVTVKGKGDYSGTATTTFRIKYDLSQASISFDRYTNVYQYTGSQIRPAVTVKVAGTAVPSSYYKVTYGENKYTGTGGSVTVAPVNFIYCMPYSATKTFTINGKSQTVTPDVYVYSAKTTKSVPFKLSATATGNEGGFAYSTVNTDVLSVDSNGYVTTKACGTAVVTITTTGNKAYNPASANVKITVKPPKGKISSVVSSSRGKMKVTFEKVAAAQKGTVRYQVMYSRDKKFSSGTYKIATFKSTKTEANAAAKKTVKGLLSGNRYYTKVRGYLVLDDGSRVYGKWSKVRSVRVK